jgi:hypothetical protein
MNDLSVFEKTIVKAPGTEDSREEAELRKGEVLGAKVYREGSRVDAIEG